MSVPDTLQRVAHCIGSLSERVAGFVGEEETRGFEDCLGAATVEYHGPFLRF